MSNLLLSDVYSNTLYSSILHTALRDLSARRDQSLLWTAHSLSEGENLSFA
jgi:hypothetical protein